MCARPILDMGARAPACCPTIPHATSVPKMSLSFFPSMPAGSVLHQDSVANTGIVRGLGFLGVALQAAVQGARTWQVMQSPLTTVNKVSTDWTACFFFNN